MLSQKLLATLPRSIRVIRQLSAHSMGGGVTLAHLRVLILIQEGMGQTQMAQSLQVSMPAVSKLINGPILKKMILKKTGPDRRSVILDLSPEGKKMLALVFGKVEKKLDLGIKRMTKKEKTQLIEGLVALEKLMVLVKEV